MVLKFNSLPEIDWLVTYGKSYNIVKVYNGTYTIINDNGQEDDYDESFFDKRSVQDERHVRLNKILNDN